MQHEYDRERADETYAEPQNERHGEGELGEENDGIEDIEIGKIDVGYELTVELERGAFAHLLGPVFQAARHRERQLPQHARLAEQVALIPQAAALVKTLSVFHNVYMGRLDRHPTWYNLRTLAWPARREVTEVERTLELVGLADKLFERAGTLSGGQQQRTSVARALYNDRSIVIGDEPVSALDRRQGAEILGKLCGRHDTVILAMHDIPLALAHADRLVVIDEGRIVLDAPARTVTPADLVPYYGG